MFLIFVLICDHNKYSTRCVKHNDNNIALFINARKIEGFVEVMAKDLKISLQIVFSQLFKFGLLVRTHFNILRGLHLFDIVTTNKKLSRFCRIAVMDLFWIFMIMTNVALMVIFYCLAQLFRKFYYKDTVVVVANSRLHPRVNT